MYRPLFVALALVAATVSLSSGCGSTGGNGGGPICACPARAGATTTYVVQDNTYVNNTRYPSASDQILAFGATASGAATASSTLTGPAGFTLQGTATDSSGNLYVLAVSAAAGPITSEVLVYTAGSTGQATPSRTITGSNTTFADPHAIAVDTSGNIYVLDTSTYGPTIDVFSSTATGNVAPSRYIRDSTAPSGGGGSRVAVDGSGNIYAFEYASPSRIVEFPASASGAVAPTRTITGPEVTQSSGVLTVDSSGDLYLATQDSTGDYAEIAYYPATDSGASTPSRILGGTALGFQSFFNSVQVDSSGWVFAVLGVEPVFPTVSYSVVSFAPQVAGSSPTTTLTSTALTNAGGLSLH